MSDFMREVDEEYRRERVMRFLSRYQVLIVVAVVAVIVGAGVWRYFVDRRVASAEADDLRFQAAEKLARDGDSAGAVKRFDALAVDGVAAYPLLARMRAAAEVALSDPEAAARKFDAIASEDGGSQAIRDAARYRGALLRVDREDPKAFDNQYGRFAVEGFAFHDGMRELLALAALKRNDGASAGHYLDEIIADPLAPPALRNRATAFRDFVASGPATQSDKAVPPAKVSQVGGPPAPAAPSEIAPVETLSPPRSNAPPPAPAR